MRELIFFMSTKLAFYFVAVLSVMAFVSCSSSSNHGGENYDDSLAFHRLGKMDKDFVEPQAPSPSSAPSKKYGSLGKDKHGVPIYHSLQRNRVARTTAYTHGESDHLVYGRKNAYGTTLKYTPTIRSAAADWSFYPLGTKFKIKGQPYTYVVDDYGSALTGTGTIDIYQPSKQLMGKWGRRYVEVTVIQWGSAEQSLAVLKTRSGYSHCRQMIAALEQRTQRVYYVQNSH